MNLIERYFDEDPELKQIPLPEIIIQSLGGTMEIADMEDGRRLYCVRDWVYEVKGSVSKQRHTPWADLKRTIERYGDFRVVEILHDLPVETPGGTFQLEFTSAEGLYAITQRMSDRSDTVRQVKSYLARAGVFVDEIRLDPEKGTEAAIEAYRRQGKDEQWIETRIQGQVARDHFIQALKAAVDIELREFHYGAATNEIYLGLWRRTAAMLKEEMELPRHAKLRDHQPQLALMYQMIAEETASIELGDAMYVTWDEAKRIVRSVAEFIGRQARATGKRLGIDIATGKPLLKSGK